MDEFIGKDEAFVKAKASRRRKALSAFTCVPSIKCLVFLCKRKQGVFVQQKAENCSFVKKQRNFVTRLLVVYVITGH